MTGKPPAARGDAPGGSAREFARFRRDELPESGVSRVPADGLCLSMFLLASPKEDPTAVLVGRIDPAADWRELGALDPRRAAAAAEGWMLPASHLMHHESPEAAADRILQEQLGLPPWPPGRLAVFSETYQSRQHPEQHRHWDLHFLRFGTAPPDWSPHHAAWRELRFVRPGETPRKEFVRAHDEILELAGFHLP